MSQWFKKFRSDINYLQESRAVAELFYSIVAIIVLGALSFAFEIELVETLYDFTRAHEDWELDEFIFSFLWVAIIASIYATRRIKDIVKLSKTNEHNANHDSLTGLPNRDFCQLLMTKMLEQAKRYKHSVAVIYIDLNDFKAINDTHGHNHGDLLVQQIGQRLLSTVRGDEIVSRLGGDEFLVVVELSDVHKNLAPIIERIQKCTDKPFDIFDKYIKASFSIGVAISPEHGESVNDLLAAADSAMYEAKRNKSLSAFYYTNELGKRNQEKARVASNIKSALTNKDFYLVYQPIVNTYTGKIEGYEALTRWELNGEPVNPEQLVSTVEDVGLSDVFFRWLMDTAVEESSHFQTPEHFISINVTVKQFLSDSFLDTVTDRMKMMNNRNINIEITESSIIADYECAVQRVRQLRELGVKVMIDDFGTGYSSLGRLRDLDIDKIKIDKSFLDYAAVNTKSADIFTSIFALATTLDIEIVAEGLETTEQLKFLRSFPPMLTQGYLLQKPSKKEHLITETEIDTIMSKMLTKQSTSSNSYNQPS